MEKERSVSYGERLKMVRVGGKKNVILAFVRELRLGFLEEKILV